jgi:hypothetical protein
VHKGSTQTNKRLKIGFKNKGAKKPSVPWSSAPDSVRCTRTVQSPNGHSRVSQGALRYNSSDCPVCHQTVRCTSGATAPSRNGQLQKLENQMNGEEQCVESEPPVRGAPDTAQCLFGAAPDCPVPLEYKASNGHKLQNPNGWVTWLAHRTMSGGAPDCPVRPSIAAQPQRLFGG